MTEYKCVDCGWILETEENGKFTQEMEDHMFFNEHHGFVEIK